MSDPRDVIMTFPLACRKCEKPIMECADCKTGNCWRALCPECLPKVAAAWGRVVQEDSPYFES